jgi:hypothetical protein
MLFPFSVCEIPVFAGMTVENSQKEYVFKKKAGAFVLRTVCLTLKAVAFASRTLCLTLKTGVFLLRTVFLRLKTIAFLKEF